MLGTMRRLWQTVRPIRFRLYLGLQIGRAHV